MLSVIDTTGGAFGNEASAEAFQATHATRGGSRTFRRTHGLGARAACNPSSGLGHCEAQLTSGITGRIVELLRLSARRGANLES